MIISVASGKGGTGKTLVATSLALSLKDSCRVMVQDCDVEEPNDHLLLKPLIDGSEPVFVRVPEIDETKCTYCGRCAKVCAFNAIAVLNNHVLTFPQMCHSCGACSYLCPENAITEKTRQVGLIEWGQADSISFVHGILTVGEAMAPPVIRQVKTHGNTEYVIIRDVSPGTSCPVVVAIKDSDFCLLVTEPTPFGLFDLKLAVETVKELGIPCGVIINRAGVGDSRVEDYCLSENIPLLLTIPLDTNIARLYSRGITLVAGMPLWQESFLKLFNQIKELVSERNRSSQR